MNVLRSIGSALAYLSEGATRLFSFGQDDYPLTGVQPFTGEPYSEWMADGDRQKPK